MPSGVYKRTEEHNRKNSESRKGKTYEEIYGEEKAEEVKGKISKASSGRKHSEEAKRKIGLTHRNKPKSEEHRANLSTAQLNYIQDHPDTIKERHNTPEAKKNHGVSSKEVHTRPEVKAKHRAAMKEVNSHPETIANHRAAGKRNWQDPEYVAKQVKSRHTYPNKPEQLLDEILQKLFPNQWKYVGSGDFIVEGTNKNPDFIHVNQKRIIEMNGDFWHGEEFTGRTKEEEEQQRIDLFAQHGYQTLIVWQHELKDIEILKDKIINFLQ